MTHSTTLVHITPNAEELISYMARVSNPANQSNTETSAKLIKYLIDHQHWSPFEMVNMCVEINTTRSIAAQILRHRSFSFQEFSQRYAEVPIPAELPKLRRQDTKNRQNSIDDLTDDTKRLFDYRIGMLYGDAYKIYKDMIAAGVAKECAREVLPLATPTRLYMNGTIRSWIHYCQLRCGNGTQLEHRIIAEGAYKLLQEHLPSVCAVLAV
jgi:thymidylate synthase (FAD)